MAQPLFTNALINEKSLYLRQHAHNPVNWYPWGQEALHKAQIENKLILVSIGYSSCHWCHVMAHECFESKFVADIMNKHFVCIKVDREERPEIDQMYMETVQMIMGQGGWPLNVFCLPDGRPFFGGTYFPPEDRGHGIIPWPQLLMRISEHFRKDPKALEENAANIVHNLKYLNQPSHTEKKNIITTEQLFQTAHQICQMHDDTWGGFGGAPKFPPSMTLDFLLAVRNRPECETEHKVLAQRIDQVVNTTLTHMAHGGIYDQIGGGFARYSVDAEWVIPHFEKMLYDNGLLLSIYTKGYLRYQNPLYKTIVEETVEWLSREMLDKNSGFSASIDADSEGKEGHYYVWTPEQVKAVLGEEKGNDFCNCYCITTKGNFEEGLTNPTLVEADFKKRQEMGPLRELLLAARKKRIAPATDHKKLLSWNCLVIQALADAGFYFNRPEWLHLAINTLNFLWEKLSINANSSTPRLHTLLYDDKPQQNGYLSDYTYFIEALLAIAGVVDWILPGQSNIYIERAQRLMHSVEKYFSDANDAGYFFTSDDHEPLFSRRKEWMDNALPSSNSSLIQACVQLSALDANPRYTEIIQTYRENCPAIIERSPSAIAHALSALMQEENTIITLKTKDVNDWSELQKTLSQKPWKRRFLIKSNDVNQQSNSFLLCTGKTCWPSTLDLKQILHVL